MTASSSLLLAPWTGPQGGTPPFDKAKVDDFKPAMLAAIEINPSYQNVGAFIVFLIVLALRPRGIFGARVLREV